MYYETGGKKGLLHERTNIKIGFKILQRDCFRKHIRCHSSVQLKQKLLNHTCGDRTEWFTLLEKGESPSAVNKDK